MTDFSEFRSPTWEEDISRNHDSDAPFVNAIPPNQMPLEAFNAASRITDELLGGRPLAEFIELDGYPIPHADDREGYQANYDARYFLNGLVDFLKIQQAVTKYDVRMNSYFDFGCASGRVLRHFCAQTEVEDLWGCDINGRHIKWLNDYLPAKLKIIHNHCLPHLPMATSSIDLISAFSVFTHVDIFETAWLSELHRILKPGGLVFLTVHNDATWDYLQKVNQAGMEDSLLKRLCRIEPRTRDWLANPLPSGRTDFRYTNVGPYRALVFHSNDYLRKTWGRYFEIAEIQSKEHGICQSVLIGRKK